MEVITHRKELIEYYEKRGYVSTGEIIAFPESDLWDKKVDSLGLAVLRKKSKDYYYKDSTMTISID